MSWLWAAISGPWAGIQAAAAQEEDMAMVKSNFLRQEIFHFLFQMPAVFTMVLFFFSLLVVVAPHSRSPSGSYTISPLHHFFPGSYPARLWIVTGLVWIVIGWFTFFVQNFTDKSEVWMSICLVT